jgi:hypothetical protein
MAISFGMFFFINADSITRRESLTSNVNTLMGDSKRVFEEIRIKLSEVLNRDSENERTRIVKLESFLRGIEDVRFQIFSKIDSLRKQEPPGKIRLMDSLLYYRINRLNEIVDGFKRDLSSDYFGTRDTLTRTELAGINVRLASLDNRIQQGADKIASKTIESSNILMSSSVTRIGTVLLLIFLVQILVTLYRYNVRLSVYYEARADLLDVINPDVAAEDIDRLADILTPGDINFGKSPSSPTQDAIDLAKQVLKGN